MTLYFLRRHRALSRSGDDLETVTAISVAVAIGGRTGGGHATQLVLTRELAAKLRELRDQVLADLGEGVLRGDDAIGLNADEQLGDVGVGDCSKRSASVSYTATFEASGDYCKGKMEEMISCLTLVTGHQDVRVVLEVLGNEVANGVILLLDQKVGAVRHAYTMGLACLAPTPRPSHAQGSVDWKTHEGKGSR